MKINIPEVLVHLRGEVVRQKQENARPSRRRGPGHEDARRRLRQPLAGSSGCRGLAGSASGSCCKGGVIDQPAGSARRLDGRPRRLPGRQPDVPRVVAERATEAARGADRHERGRVRPCSADPHGAGGRPGQRTPEDVLDRADYLRTDRPSARAERIDLFIERVREYKATVSKVAAGGTSRKRSPQACSRRGVKKLVVPADLPDGWAPA